MISPAIQVGTMYPSHARRPFQPEYDLLSKNQQLRAQIEDLQAQITALSARITALGG